MNDAVKYTEANWIPKRDARDILAKYIDGISWAPGDLVLDIGCGPGDVTADVLLPILPTDIGKIVGIDVSNAMVKHAEASQRHPKLCFAQMDIATKHLDKDKLREMTDTKIDKHLNKDELGEMTDTKIDKHLNKDELGEMTDIKIDKHLNKDELGDMTDTKIDKHLNKDKLGEMTDTEMDIATKELNKDKLKEMTDNYSRQRLVEGIFNKVFSFYCLHWVQDQKQAFKNVYELMKPGGEGLVIFLPNNPVFEMYEVLAENPKWNPYMKDMRCHISPYHKSKDPSGEVSSVLRHVGFQVMNCINGKRSFPFESVSHFKRLTEAVNPFIDRIPQHLRDAYMGDCISAFGKMKSVNFFDRNNLNEDGHVVHFNYELIVAHFKKVSGVKPSTNEAIKKIG